MPAPLLPAAALCAFPFAWDMPPHRWLGQARLVNKLLDEAHAGDARIDALLLAHRD
jgi:hypothetical protein